MWVHQRSENNLACSFDPDHMIARTEIIEYEVVMGDDICCGQHFVVPREVGIARERNVVT